jgi:hypothetical protein
MRQPLPRAAALDERGQDVAVGVHAGGDVGDAAAGLGRFVGAAGDRQEARSRSGSAGRRPSCRGTARQAEHVLGHVRQDQVGRDRRHLVQPRLAELALDVVFAGKAEAAVVCRQALAASQEALAARYLAMLASAPQGWCASNSGRPCSASGWRPRPRCSFGDRELHALVLADGAVEHHALGRVARRAVDEPVAVADASAAISVRSAFRPSRMYLKPLPSSPIRFSAGISRLSKKSSLVSWLTMLRIGRTQPLADRLAQVDDEDRHAFGSSFLTSASGVVRASRIIRSECWMREIHTFWPLTT